jgi:anti-anti-sigma factor
MNIRNADRAVIFDLTLADLAQITPMLEALEYQLREECAQRVIANLEAIESIYSIQIGTLVAMHVKCYENLAVMKLANVNKHVRNQLQIVGLEKLMEIHHGTAAALESFGKTR